MTSKNSWTYISYQRQLLLQIWVSLVILLSLNSKIQCSYANLLGLWQILSLILSLILIQIIKYRPLYYDIIPKTIVVNIIIFKILPIILGIQILIIYFPVIASIVIIIYLTLRINLKISFEWIWLIPYNFLLGILQNLNFFILSNLFLIIFYIILFSPQYW